MLLFDKSIRLSRLKLANDFGGISVMKFCSKRLNNYFFVCCKFFSWIWIKKKKISYNSVVSSGKAVGTVVKLFSRQSTIPSAHLHGWGHSVVAPHSIGACSVKPKTNYRNFRSYTQTYTSHIYKLFQSHSSSSSLFVTCIYLQFSIIFHSIGM